ncbi:MAG: DUF1523 family protein [Alphaproteobacteria bacterium]|nr:MAG: DUF1523 family protein [Alphaproteobacteria bacterium]
MRAPLLVVGAVALTAVFGGSAAYQYGTQDHVTFTVTDKDRITTGSGESISSKYIVSTKDASGKIEVFENTDAWLQGKFNSSDVQAELEVGKSYEADVYGWRLPFFSTYRNIVDVEETATIKYSRPAPKAPGS